MTIVLEAAVCSPRFVNVPPGPVNDLCISRDRIIFDEMRNANIYIKVAIGNRADRSCRKPRSDLGKNKEFDDRPPGPMSLCLSLRRAAQLFE